MIGTNDEDGFSDAVNLKSPILLGDGPILSQGDYDVFVGAPVEDSFPMYVVINRQHDVIEYTNEVLPLVRDWLNHFSPIATDKAPVRAGLN